MDRLELTNGGGATHLFARADWVVTARKKAQVFRILWKRIRTGKTGRSHRWAGRD
jgi:hypothetical protein